jgi:hypothetical protein
LGVNSWKERFLDASGKNIEGPKETKKGSNDGQFPFIFEIHFCLYNFISVFEKYNGPVFTKKIIMDQGFW